jgi:hypothetical protein
LALNIMCIIKYGCEYVSLDHFGSTIDLLCVRQWTLKLPHVFSQCSPNRHI